jgi:hypothetical protein
VLGTSDQPGIGQFAIPDSPGRYTLRATATRAELWSAIGTRANVSWTFREPGAGAPARPLPLFVVRAAGAVDAQGRARAGGPYPLTLSAQGQPGNAAVRLAALKVEVSYDDGTTWSAAPTRFTGDRGVAVLQHPAGDGFASLRIFARDCAGNTVSQTVVRAYQISAESGGDVRRRTGRAAW